jgi:hypothetical protein
MPHRIAVIVRIACQFSVTGVGEPCRTIDDGAENAQQHASQLQSLGMSGFGKIFRCFDELADGLFADQPDLTRPSKQVRESVDVIPVGWPDPGINGVDEVQRNMTAEPERHDDIDRE